MPIEFQRCADQARENIGSRQEERQKGVGSTLPEGRGLYCPFGVLRQSMANGSVWFPPQFGRSGGLFSGGAEGFQRKSPGIGPGFRIYGAERGDLMINPWLKTAIKFLMTLEVKLRIRWIR